MRETLIKAIRAFTGADLPGFPAKPMALRLFECFAALVAIVWCIAIFMAMEPTA